MKSCNLHDIHIGRETETHAVVGLMGPGRQDSETTLMVEVEVVTTLGGLSVITCGNEFRTLRNSSSSNKYILVLDHCILCIFVTEKLLSLQELQLGLKIYFINKKRYPFPELHYDSHN